jgi:hypothetical protein
MNAFQRELGNLQHRQQLLYILLFSFATVVVWIGVSLLTSQRRTGIPPETLLLATPLNPTINTPLLEEIKGKRAYTEEELRLFPIYKVVVNRDGGADELVDISQPAPVEATPLNGTDVETPLTNTPTPSATPASTAPTQDIVTEQPTTQELPPGAVANPSDLPPADSTTPAP